MVNTQLSKEHIFNLLSVIADPEIPVVSIREMGMLRDVNMVDGRYEVVLTPTYMGCPAMKLIENDIIATLKMDGIDNVSVKMTYSPAWTTDWMSDEAREKLRIYGIAPPQHSSCHPNGAEHAEVPCPRCGSVRTSVISRFGATACKALYKCSGCMEPFEYFKCF